MRHFSVLAVFLAVLCTSFTFSQDYPEISDPNFKATNTGISGEGIQPSYPDQHSGNNNQSDEFGEFRDNAVLSGLNNAANYVSVPNNSLFDQNFDGSIEAWVRPTAYTSGGASVVSKNLSFLFGVNTTGAIFFRIGGTVFTSTGNVPTGAWTHIAAVWSGGPSTFSVAFYINGALQNTAGPTAATWDLNTNTLRIGASEQFASAVFNGLVDDVRFWTTTRTTAEIRDGRFTSVGDMRNSNTSSALTSSSFYNGLVSSWTFGNASTAFDDISGFNGSYVGGAAASNTLGGQPIPYNFALRLFDGVNDNVNVPHSTVFNQTAAGSIDAWINLSAVGSLNTIVSKGTTFANHNFAFYVTASNKIGLNIGAHNYISTGPVTFVANRWYHVAATWSGGPNFTVTIYVDGVVDHTSTFNLAMPTNTDPLKIGAYYNGDDFSGYIDELRVWSNALTADQVRAYMFNSGRSGTMTGLVAHWNFDGNLLNFGSGTGIDGTFNTGGTNNSRMSAYSNESTSGAISGDFIAHKSVLNRDVSPNPFVGGFAMRTPFTAIPATGTITSTITIPGSGTVTSVELFLAIDHTFAGDLDITLTSPNGQVRDITSDNGGGSDNGYLCFFVDGASTLVTDANYLPPYSNLVRPEVLMGNMGGSATNGTWTLSITDDATGDSGVLKGWGIRLNGTTTAIQPITNNIPNRFNLYQNYPNPFNPVSNIKFDIAKSSNVKLVVYDILGKEVKTLVNEFTQAGQYEVPFDGSNLASGTYFFRIEAGDFTDVKKMILVK